MCDVGAVGATRAPEALRAVATGDSPPASRARRPGMLPGPVRPRTGFVVAKER
ncbi:MAG: hypothetical protein QME71_07970 [Dehalococcoidia bacterium]|nr:hypothetical protein [Dehalococcoidia bacterium]